MVPVGGPGIPVGGFGLWEIGSETVAMLTQCTTSTEEGESCLDVVDVGVRCMRAASRRPLQAEWGPGQQSEGLALHITRRLEEIYAQLFLFKQ